MNLMRALQRKVTSERFDIRGAELGMYGVSLVVLVLGVHKLVLLKLSEANLFFGLLLVLTVSMLGGITGLLMGMRAQISESRRPPQI